MADDNAASEGTYERRETPQDRQQRDSAEVKLWLDALALADKEESDWRDDAAKVIQRYRGEKDYANERYRLLYANVQTTAPALYNTVPIPDIRRRFGDRDEDAKQIGQALERCISCQMEKSDFDSVMEEATLDRLLPGRSVTRIRHNREVIEGYTKETVTFEPVAWDDFRRGPAKRWEDVPWEAFRLFLTREQIEGLIEEAGGDKALAERVPLNATISGAKKEGDSTQPPTVFKRALVWQFWDKDTKSLVYVCPDMKEAPLAKVPDTMQLEGFFPNPRPMLALRSPASLVPVAEYTQYALLARDLEDATERLASLVAAAKAVGLTAKELAGAFAGLANMKDGQLAAADEAFALAQNGKIDDAIWFWPIDTIVAAIRELYLAREEIKKTIYEVMGLSDILRGSTEASETLGAQQIKAQWGSARLQRAQADVARYARDLLRLGVEVIATKFEPQSVMLASGIQLTEQQVELMRRDVMREYRIDVETDSTIRADLTRHQENMGQFVQGFAALVTALGPVVEAGMMPGETAAALLTGFARNFKLGKQAEDALEKLGDSAQQQQQQPKPPSPEEMKAQADAQREDKKLLLDEKKHNDTMLFQEKQHNDTMLLEKDKAVAEDQRARDKANKDYQLKADSIVSAELLKRDEMTMRDRHESMMREHSGEVADFAKSGTAKQVGGMMEQLAPALQAVGEGLARMGEGMEQQAQATGALAQAVAAETELVRDPTTGRAVGARKKPPQQVVN